MCMYMRVCVCVCVCVAGAWRFGQHPKLYIRIRIFHRVSVAWLQRHSHMGIICTCASSCINQCVCGRLTTETLAHGQHLLMSQVCINRVCARACVCVCVCVLVCLHVFWKSRPWCYVFFFLVPPSVNYDCLLMPSCFPNAAKDLKIRASRSNAKQVNPARSCPRWRAGGFKMAPPMPPTRKFDQILY